ncbi:hypothetical protein SAMN06295910_0735 [Allosphingosinicella indica]|uniref:Uncharacterized protein n=1 Tax=Allosphingosinicella indica TaxID=941907 RepID=A0A1X7G067_9SPHN|nr:hypothetical protein SAMN06295910_0735 [Allosphingosinicella indica]
MPVEVACNTRDSLFTLLRCLPFRHNSEMMSYR